MFTRKRPEPSKLDEVIDELLNEMLATDIDSDEYSKLLEKVTKLYKLKEPYIPKALSRDTLLLVAGNLAGIILILSYERVNILTSKAAGFVMKLR
jgi:hypothetical protein